ncbi:MAG: beta-propeller fold lactonase family protein [Prolixibacteraceae bacterium]|nr:beta-propeller fold lactonase family protein [Burkholderiales bacterium]
MSQRPCALLLGVSLTFCASASIETRLERAPLDFRGRALVAISDADMLASAYVDGILGPREGRDALSVVHLDADSSRTQAYSVEVSNSVAGPPSAVATTADGRFAFVVETFRQRSEGATTFRDLQPGSRLSVIDLNDLRAPGHIHSLEVGTRPTSVSVNPAGDLVAVALHPVDGRQLALIPFDNGRLSKPTYTGLPGVPKELESPHVEWHPSGRFIAVTVFGRNEIVFYAVQRDTDKISIQPWGKPVQVGKYPMMGRFTPDGRYFVNVNLYWGRDVEGFWITAPRGDVTVTRFDNINDEPAHRVVSRAETGVSPEGIAISPDGRFVVTTNLERSYLPYTDVRITWYSSLTLLSLDLETGRIRSHGESLYDGILPEAAAFDASGRYIAVANFDHFDDSTKGGSIDFWRIVDDLTSNGPKLVRTTHTVPVARGPHSMVLIR